MALRCRMTLSEALSPNLSTPQILSLLRKNTGPISLSFEIPMFNISNLQVKSSTIIKKILNLFNFYYWYFYDIRNN